MNNRQPDEQLAVAGTGSRVGKQLGRLLSESLLLKGLSDSVRPLLARHCERHVRKTEIYPAFTARLQWCRDALFAAAHRRDDPLYVQEHTLQAGKGPAGDFT
jgi:hypothetical protein